MGRRDDSFGDTIRFLLVGIAGLTDAELRLNRATFEQLPHRLVAERLLEP
jgi:hypothetical protein